MNSTVRLSNCSFAVTGDDFEYHLCGGYHTDQPSPKLEGDVESGGSIEGWVSYLIPKELKKLIFIIKDPDAISSGIVENQYVALDEGASIIDPADLASIVPNDVGKDSNNPALKTDTIITASWQFSILEVVRGQAAHDKMLADDSFSPQPGNGMEFIIVRANIKRIDNENRQKSIDSYMFGSSGSKGVLYDASQYFNSAKPNLQDIALFPGGEVERWFVLEIAIGEENAVLVFNKDNPFNPLYNRKDENDLRYISLE